MGGGTLAQRCKALEEVEAGRAAMPRLPLLARLDGRAFHTYTRGLPRPYDERLSSCMVDTTRFLVGELGARVGYTQSDEITLLWHAPSGLPDALPFRGRFQKLASVLAGAASAQFTVLSRERIPERAGALGVFDARVWNVPTWRTPSTCSCGARTTRRRTASAWPPRRSTRRRSSRGSRPPSVTSCCIARA